MAPAAVASATSVETPAAVETSAPAVEAAKAGPSPGSVASCNPAMAEPTEGPGMCCRRCVRVVGPTKSLMSVETSAMRIAGILEVASIPKIVAIDYRPAMRNVGVVVVDNSPIVVPIVSPMVPTPAEAGI